GPASRADLARASGLTRATVSDLVAALLEDGLVEELGVPVESRVGKPPMLVGLAADANHIVAVDLSADAEIAGAVVNLAGHLISRTKRHKHGSTGAEAVRLVQELVAELVASTSTPVLGVGIGSPGVVAPDGTIVNAPNLGWTDVALADDVRRATGLPTYVANDANTAVLGEHTFGRADDGGLMLVRVGRGVGAGLVLEGLLLHGHHGAAGEIGHVTVDPEGAMCACGRRGCLETILAVPHLREALGEKPEAALRAAGVHLGVALAPVVGTLNLHELVLSGPADLLEGPLREAVEEVVRERTMPATSEQLVVRTSTLGDDVVIVGAAGLVLAGELGVS
ncbi:MAG: ROK family protein, partial [Nocardioides sp.]|nr:ROK family protein [Nocardioides sp.]